ncbi:MAG: Unknown protein [uncultured Sulfurovum sp.]|uniref:Uncharacterized protein n=1 Tax=uncultured Sulfurovum sp. TaxID=269237 RepID=A0A6S6T4B4_9BACT|nr:MAG: Unknown protein [uncultured Sulfurovum sp.]
MRIMGRKEILMNTKWDEFEMGTCRLFVNLFNQYIPFIFFQEHKPLPGISDRMIIALNQVMALDKDEQDFDFDGLGTNKVKEIHLDQDNDNLSGIYAEIIMDTASGHYLSLIVKDAKVVAIDKEGSYFDRLIENK